MLHGNHDVGCHDYQDVIKVCLSLFLELFISERHQALALNTPTRRQREGVTAIQPWPWRCHLLWLFLHAAKRSLLPIIYYHSTAMPSTSRHRHRNLPFFPEQPPSAYGCQQTWEHTFATPLTFLLPKKTYCSLSAHSESYAACPAKSILLGTCTSVKLA